MLHLLLVTKGIQNATDIHFKKEGREVDTNGLRTFDHFPNNRSRLGLQENAQILECNERKQTSSLFDRFVMFRKRAISEYMLNCHTKYCTFFVTYLSIFIKWLVMSWLGSKPSTYTDTSFKFFLGYRRNRQVFIFLRTNLSSGSKLKIDVFVSSIE